MGSNEHYISCAINRLDLELFMYKSLYKDRIFVLIRASLRRLKLYAESIQLQMKLDPKVAEEMMVEGNPDAGIAPVKM